MIASFVLALLLSTPVVGQADQIDDFIKTQMKRQNIPGLSLVVIKDGTIVKAAGYGLANIKLQTPATPETVYRIASVSKQFIATGIMLLVQEGLVGVDDPISKYLEGTPAAWKGITMPLRFAPGEKWEYSNLGYYALAEVIRTPATLNDGTPCPYGFGWQLSSVGGRRLVHHSGGMLGFRARFARFVDDGLTIIVLMNLDDVDPDAIVHGVSALYLPAPGR